MAIDLPNDAWDLPDDTDDLCLDEEEPVHADEEILRLIEEELRLTSDVRLTPEEEAVLAGIDFSDAVSSPKDYSLTDEQREALGWLEVTAQSDRPAVYQKTGV